MYVFKLINLCWFLNPSFLPSSDFDVSDYFYYTQVLKVFEQYIHFARRVFHKQHRVSLQIIFTA